jgi:hypothetical protein
VQFQTRDLIAKVAEDSGWIVQFTQDPGSGGSLRGVHQWWACYIKSGIRIDCYTRDDYVWMARLNPEDMSHGPEIHIMLHEPESIMRIQEYLRSMDICPTKS